MSDTKEKIIERLSSLIEEGKKLKDGIQSSEDPNLHMWMMRATKLLERMGGDKLKRDFNMAGAFSYNTHGNDRYFLEYAKKSIEAETNFLIATREDAEMFDEKDEPQLKNIKNKFEAGFNFGIFKGKASTEREHDKK